MTESVPKCAECGEIFEGGHDSDDFLSWEFCAGRSKWTCRDLHRSDWSEKPCCEFEEEEKCGSFCQFEDEE